MQYFKTVCGLFNTELDIDLRAQRCLSNSMPFDISGMITVYQNPKKKPPR